MKNNPGRDVNGTVLGKSDGKVMSASKVALRVLEWTGGGSCYAFDKVVRAHGNE
jgi:hypothetical protein